MELKWPQWLQWSPGSLSSPLVARSGPLDACVGLCWPMSERKPCADRVIGAAPESISPVVHDINAHCGLVPDVKTNRVAAVAAIVSSMARP